MSGLNYYNKDGDQLYILHFPGHGLQDFTKILDCNRSRKFKISDKISVISTMNHACWENSPLKAQCEHNGIAIHNTALSEKEWSNPLKIKHSLMCLDEIDTEYALMLDGRDVVITADMDEVFLDKFRQFGKPILYNGTPVAFPKVVVEPLSELVQIKGKQKFLNAGVCFGEVGALKEFYTTCEELSATMPDNKSEQLIVRMVRQKKKDLVAIDHTNKVFRICHPKDTIIKEDGNDIILI